jgi:hypothetical protein
VREPRTWQCLIVGEPIPQQLELETALFEERLKKKMRKTPPTTALREQARALSKKRKKTARDLP